MRARALAAGWFACAAPPTAAIFHHRTSQPTPPPPPPPTPTPPNPAHLRLMATIGQADALEAVDINAAGTLAAFGGERGKVYLHTVDAAANATASLATLDYGPVTSANPEWRVDSVALNAAGTVLAVARKSVHLYVIDAGKGVVRNGSTFSCPGGNPGDGAPQVAMSVALNGEGTLLALSCGCTGSRDNPFAGVYAVDPSTAEVGPARRADVPSESNGFLNKVALSRDARDGRHVLAVAGNNHGAHIYTVDAANATISKPTALASPVADRGAVISVALSADGGVAAVGSGVKPNNDPGHAVVATYSFPPGAQPATMQAAYNASGFGGFAEAVALDAAGESLAVGIGGPAGGGSTIMFSVQPSSGVAEYVTQLGGPQTQAVAFNKAGSLLACATHTSHPGLQLWVR